MVFYSNFGTPSSSPSRAIASACFSRWICYPNKKERLRLSRQSALEADRPSRRAQAR